MGLFARSVIVRVAAVSLLAAVVPTSVALAAAGRIQLASVHAVVGDLEDGEILYTKRDDVLLTVPLHYPKTYPV